MNREKEIVKISFLGIIVDIVLAAFKMAVGFLSNSIAIIMDGVNNLTVGIYASNTEGEIFAEMKRTLSNLIEEYPEILQMHGFYADTDKMTVYFDLIIDFRAENKEQIEDEVVRRMKERFTDYEFVAVLDSDVSD